jgi:murein DD-endopeptidase MepM/ murein hydrolase activator NlpD
MAGPAWSLPTRQARQRRRRHVASKIRLPQRALARDLASYPLPAWLLLLLKVVLSRLSFVERMRRARQAALQARAVLNGIPDLNSRVSGDLAARQVGLSRVFPLPRVSTRFAAHVVTITVVITTAFISSIISPLTGTPRDSAPRRRSALGQVADVRVARTLPAQEAERGDVLAAPALRLPRPQDVPVFEEFYAPREGETLGEIAARFGVSVASVFWANGLQSGDVLMAGQELRIPRLSGIPYVVQRDDTLESVARLYSVPIEAIVQFSPNRIGATSALPIEREIFIPGGTLPYPPEILAQYGSEQGVAETSAVVAGMTKDSQINIRTGPGREYSRVGYLDVGRRLKLIARHNDWIKVEAGEHGAGWVRGDLLGLTDVAIAGLPETNDFPPPPPRWVWPTNGELTSSFGWRSKPFRSFHDGLDLANRAGTNIVAASGGKVTEAGWCGGFGYCVEIDHGDGLTTLYAHMLKRPPVATGDTVATGDLIGWMGSTFDRRRGGYSTGVHLHFILRVNGKAVNPLKFLA